ncbi:MAG TPA: type I methionyl aminopeptidase [Candidatus Paceibacterota bacterium]|nr:type I methionyl aminopeptidase [Candidatus Paceibacterota bacterium]HRZ34309.1 type I methionyl aminopeptidase [Candidatus Paceibacterota bacterium]
MIKLKTKEEIAKLRIAGRKLAKVLKETAKLVKPGVKSFDLNNFAHQMIIKMGCRPSFLNYKPTGVRRPFPASICLSINDEIVHGIPNESEKEIKTGDVVKVDIGLVDDGLFVDSATTVIVGDAPKEVRELVSRTKEALNTAIKQCRVGGHIGDVGAAVEKVAKRAGLSVAKELTGHGVGYAVHEAPYVPNSGRPGQGEKIENGLVIAIEPMLCLGRGDIMLARDGHTYKTRDGSLAAQFEHTIAVTEEGPIILTEN